MARFRERLNARRGGNPVQNFVNAPTSVAIRADVLLTTKDRRRDASHPQATYCVHAKTDVLALKAGEK